MNKIIKLHKGLDIPIEGVAVNTVSDARKGLDTVAVCPPDFIGYVPRVIVSENDTVEVGTPLFVDKRNEAQKITSPVSGKVVAVERGERRKLLSVKIENDGEFRSVAFEKADIESMDAQKVIDIMNTAGISAYLRQRPFDIVPDTSVQPRDIFISMFSTMPLAADYNIMLNGKEDYVKAGVKALSKIAPVYVGISPNQKATFGEIDGAEVNVFEGANPAGNVGVQINNVKPVNKG